VGKAKGNTGIEIMSFELLAINWLRITFHIGQIPTRIKPCPVTDEIVGGETNRRCDLGLVLNRRIIIVFSVYGFQFKVGIQ
jgi:hypothetical protein